MPKEDAAPAAAVEAAAPAPEVPESSVTLTPGLKYTDPAAVKSTEEPKPRTLAEGADDPVEEVKALESWPDNWRERLAAGDAEELKRLGRFQSPESIWKKIRSQDKYISDKTTLRKPGEDATEKQIAEWREAQGLAETPEKLLEGVRLPDGRVIGDADKPLAQSFVQYAHKADFTPAQASAAMAWYFDQQEAIMASQIEAEEAYMVESRRALKEEWGPGRFDANINRVADVFAMDPNGADLMARVFSARDASGRKLGNNPDLLKFFVGLSQELNPLPTSTAGANTGGGSSMSRLEEIRGWQKASDPALREKYWTKEVQAEELKLIELEQKQKARMQPRGETRPW